MAGKPWEKNYNSDSSESSGMKLKPWEKQYGSAPKAEAPTTRETTVNDFIPNLDTPMAMVKGFNQGALLGYAPNVLGAMTNPMDYTRQRDAYDADIKQTTNSNPLAYYTGQAVGGILPALAAPFTKAVGAIPNAGYLRQMMGLAGDAALQAGVMNPGNVKGEITPIQAQDRINNAETAAVMAPLVATGLKGVSKIPEVPGMMRNQAEKWIYKSTGPQLSNQVVDQMTGRDREIGRYMLDTPGLAEYGGSTASVAKKSEPMLAGTGKKLNNLFDKVDDLFSKAETKPGFDPVQDKAKLMAEGKKELGMTEGAGTALNRLSTYIDERAADHIGGPILPDAPRNPMKPSEMRQMKTAMDERVKYSRNPQNPDPATDKAFYGGRTYMNDTIDNTVKELAPDQLPILKDLNREYSLQKSIDDYSNKREARDAVNKGVGLTDWISLSSNNPLLYPVKKAGEKFGYQTGGRAFEDLGKAGQDLSKKLNLDLNLGALNQVPPEMTNNMVLRYLMMNPQEK